MHDQEVQRWNTSITLVPWLRRIKVGESQYGTGQMNSTEHIKIRHEKTDASESRQPGNASCSIDFNSQGRQLTSPDTATQHLTAHNSATTGTSQPPGDAAPRETQHCMSNVRLLQLHM
jgi:hypothetical protein